LAYNTEPVDEFSSWDEIEQSEYGDLISLHATPSVRFANAAAAAGEDINQIGDDAVFNAIADKVEAQHQNVFQYWTSGDQQMQFLREEQAHISSAWGGRVASLQADDVPIEYFIPEEGAVTHSEGYAIPEASENKETVYDLLDWVYQRENSSTSRSRLIIRSRYRIRPKRSRPCPITLITLTTSSGSIGQRSCHTTIRYHRRSTKSADRNSSRVHAVRR